MEPASRTGHYWIVWEERHGRWRLRALSRAGVALFLLLALLAASAGVLIAMTQHGWAWAAWIWAVWVIGVALAVGRILRVHANGLVRHSTPFTIRNDERYEHLSSLDR